MANDFKRFQVNNVTTSTGASGDALYTAVGVSNGAAKESIIIGITLANTSAFWCNCRCIFRWKRWY